MEEADPPRPGVSRGGKTMRGGMIQSNSLEEASPPRLGVSRGGKTMRGGHGKSIENNRDYQDHDENI